MGRGTKILITGGLGFIFSHVTEFLVRRGYEVVVVDNCSTGSHPEIVDGSFRFINKDLSDDDAWRIILEEDPRWIIHSAAITDVDFSLANPRKTIDNNVLSALNVFKAAKQQKNLEKLLYVNTDEVYGECDYPKKETDIMFPRNPYSASKAMASYIRTSYDISYPSLKDKTTEIRMCNIFGERQDKTKIMSRIKKYIETGEPVPLQEEGRGYREYLYVKNIPPLIEMILEKGNRVYNITNNDGLTVSELIKKVSGLINYSILTKPAQRLCHDLKYTMDNSRIKELGWKPIYTLEQGLREYFL